MPTAYYGSRISPHITKTPEGFLICRDVPINRVGSQTYMGSELGLKGEDAMKPFNVLRRKEEVFSPATLASFEGKSVCDEHPPEDVTAENSGILSKGHMQNVRADPASGHTLADLFITDKDLIDEILNGKREVSCGYIYDTSRNKNGTFEQRNIRGNHVAIVNKGRAGPRVRINDSKPNEIERGNNMSEKKGSVLGRMFHVFAKDESTTPEDLEEAAKMVSKGKDEEVIKPKGTASPETEMPDTTPESEAKDDDPVMAKLDEICGRLDRLESKESAEDDDDELSKMAEAHKEHEEGETPEEEQEEHEEGDPDGYDEVDNENDVTVPPEDIEKKDEVVKAADSALQMQKAAAIARDILHKAYPKPADYKVHAKDTAAKLRKAYGIPKGSNDGYNKIMNTANTMRSRRVHDGAMMAHDSRKIDAETQNFYDKLNPHMKGDK